MAIANEMATKWRQLLRSKIRQGNNKPIFRLISNLGSLTKQKFQDDMP